MKRILFSFLLIVLCLFLFCISSFASSPAYFTFISVTPASAGGNTLLDDGFYKLNSAGWNNGWTILFDYSSVSSFAQYYSDGEAFFTIFPMFLDSSHRPIPLSDYPVNQSDYFNWVRVLVGGGDSSLFTLSDPYLYFYYDDFFGSHDSIYNIYFFFKNNASFQPSYVRFLVIPYIEDISPDVYCQSLIDSYETTFLYNSGYSDGFTDGELSAADAGYQEGYNAGYQSGLDNAKTSFYLRAFDDGFYQGLDAGYQSGYEAGQSDDVSRDLKGLFLSAVSSPFVAISNFLNFDVFGINFRAIFAFLFASILFVFVLKHFIK